MKLPDCSPRFLFVPACLALAFPAVAAPPKIRSFEVGGNTPFVLGEGAKLRWTVRNAERLSISPGVGVVKGRSVRVYPRKTTVYTLVAKNASGRASRKLRVTVIDSAAGNPVAFPTPNAGISHPRIWVTPSSVATLRQRAASNDPAWTKLRDACDRYLTMAILLPDQTPAGDTINGGYQYNDYLLPSEQLALGYLAARSVDPSRAARYAAKERQLLLALSDPVHHGRPTTDSGYSIRSYVPALAIGYDWIFETLSDADRYQIFTEINRWVASYEATGFGRDFPQGNYFAGYYCAKALGALATEGENPKGAAMWNDWLNRVHLGMVQPYYKQWLSGGGAPDGWNYGPFETVNMLRAIAAANTAKGLDLIHDATKPFAYPDGHARWMAHFTWPDLDTVSDRGLVYDGDNPTPADAGWATEYSGLLRISGGTNAPIMQRYALDLRTRHGTGGVDPWVEFLFHDASATATDYRTDLSLMTPGDGQVAMRSSWTADAVWGAFQAGPYTGFPDSAEELFDEGSLTIQRGGVQFLVNGWGALMRNTPGTSDGSANKLFDRVYNELYGTQTDGVRSGRRIFNTFYAVRSAGYWGQVGNGPEDSDTTLSHFEDGGRYVLMRGEHLESQYSGDHPIQGWTRTVVYVRPQLFIAYDRTTIAAAATDNWMAWHVAAAPAEQMGAVAGTHRFDVVDTRAAFGGNLFRGRVTTLLPVGNVVTSVDVFGRGKVYRLEVRPGAPSASTNWLSVFDAASSAANAYAAEPLTPTAGNVLAGAVEGTLLTSGGGNVAVLLSSSGSTVATPVSLRVPAVATSCIVTDLSPGASYAAAATVAGGDTTLVITPGAGSFHATAQGTLSVSVSASGEVTPL